MKTKDLYIYENGALTPLRDTKIIICGLYAAVGYNDESAGNLFAVVAGPALFPVYDKTGKRKNVGADRGGLSYNFRRGEWYKE